MYTIMDFSYYNISPILAFLILCFHVTITATLASNNSRAANISALYVFGDSTVDPGNNNYLPTPFKGNFPPYGRDFNGQIPTGRFSNGKLTTDFIASYVGVKDYLPPYLDPTLSFEELMTGVSFASAGSGFDPLTAQFASVMNIPNQLEKFKDYKETLESGIGKQKAEDHIKKAVFIVSAGTNDFVINYFTLPFRRRTYTVSTYQQFILHKVKEIIEALREEGAQKIIIVGLPPMGCLPIVITLNSDNAILKRGCIEKFNLVARGYNRRLQNEILDSMEPSLDRFGTKIRLVDIYSEMENMIQGPGRSGFDVVNKGCCGSGYAEATFLCNPSSYACPDASKYVFWDSIHPSEKAYFEIFKAIRPVLDDIIKN